MSFKDQNLQIETYCTSPKKLYSYHHFIPILQTKLCVHHNIECKILEGLQFENNTDQAKRAK